MKTIYLKKQSVFIQNLVIFLLLSVFYLHTLNALSGGYSAFVITDLKHIIYQHLLLVVFMFMNVLLIIRANRKSALLLPLYLAAIFFYGMSYYYINHNKIILFLNFFYFVFSAYFSLFWYLELAMASLCPHYSAYGYGPKCYQKISVKFEIQEKILEGHLTNWDEHSCFIYFDAHSFKGLKSSIDPEKWLKKIVGKAQLKISYNKEFFSSEVEIVSYYEGGLGVTIIEKQTNNSRKFGWNDFFLIIRNRGEKPVLS